MENEKYYSALEDLRYWVNKPEGKNFTDLLFDAMGRATINQMKSLSKSLPEHVTVYKSFKEKGKSIFPENGIYF